MVYVWMAVGIAVLVAGGELLIRHSSRLAVSAGISPLVVGLTVVAFGTSAPEMITSVYGRLAGETSVAIGNVVGSNLFNRTGVLGVTGLLGTGGLTVPPSVLRFDMLVLIATAILCLPIMFTGRRIDRWEGGIFVLYYIGYVTYLVLAATGHAAAPSFGIAMVAFVVPLTVLTFGVVGYREFGGE